ncbi:MAG: hypothetical protein WD048_09955 [Chitinophagales bacterium]
MKFFSRLFTAIIFIGIYYSISAQESSADWVISQGNSNFEISTKKINCSDASKGISKEYLFLKIENKSKNALQLDYKIEKWYDEVCSNCDLDERENSSFSIELAAGESATGSCKDYRNRKLAVFSKMTGTAKARKLTDFKIIPLAVNGENVK